MLSGVEGGNDTTRMATRVGSRGHESGLGGHEKGVSVDDEGVENASIPLLERGRMAMSDSTTFSGFVPVRKDFFCGDQNSIGETCQWDFISLSPIRIQLIAEVFQ